MRFTRYSCALSLVILVVASSIAYGQSPSKPLRVGLIGLDTSHVIEFTRTINSPNVKGDLADIKIVAGYPGGSPDVHDSVTRVEGFTNQLRAMGIEIVGSIDELLKRVDAVMIESVDGRPHLAQAKPVIAAGKRLFIDKPMAGSMVDVIRIFRLAKANNVPVFSCSSQRFGPGYRALHDGTTEFGKVRNCMSFGPFTLEPHHPDFYWYAIHGVEGLFTIMGPGCKTVIRVAPDKVVGVWSDGRLGIYSGEKREVEPYSALIDGTKKSGPAGGFFGYEVMLVEVAKFFKTGKPPISAEETIELMAFMEGADESKRQGGAPVNIAEVIKKAEQQASEDGKHTVNGPK